MEGAGGGWRRKRTHKPPSQCSYAAAAPPGTEAQKDARTDVPGRPLRYLGLNLLRFPMRPQLLDEAQGAWQDVVLVHKDAEARDGGGPQGARRLPAARASCRPLLHAP